MGNLILYILACVIVVAFIIGFFGYSMGGVIQVLLIVALIAIIVRITRGSK